MPLDVLRIILYPVVLTLYLNKGYRTAEEFQRCIERDAVACRHIGIGRSMHEQQGRVYLISIVEWAMVYIQAAVRPGIAVGHAHLAVGIAPVATAPVGSMVTDAGMGHSGGEDVCLRL